MVEGPRTLWHRTPRPVRDFLVLSVVLFVVLGVVLSSVIEGIIEARYLAMYGQSAELTVSSVAAIVLADPGLEGQVLRSGPGALSSTVSGLVGVVFYTPDGKVEFAEHGGASSPPGGIPAIARRALASGDPVAAFGGTAPPSLHLRAPTLELAVPVRQGGAIVGVVHAYRSAASLQRAISAGVRRADLILGAALGSVWLLLFPVVLSASRRLRRQSMRDVLTGLANRELFADRILKAMALAERSDEKVGLLLLDLDRFKEVNDGLGHKRGDDLLRQVAGALAGEVRAADTLARLGGDEYAVVLTGIHHHDECVAAAERLLAALEVPVVIGGVAVAPQASVGISVYPDHGRDADGLLGKADIAMYWAKATHQSVAIYSPDKDFSVPARLGLVAELRKALANDEILCHYQPLVRTSDGRVCGFEALVRWEHPSRGLLLPADFLPVVEQAGLIQALTARVLTVALRECRTWLDEGLDLAVAVNLSARCLRDVCLPEMVFAALDDAGVAARNLELEITEDALLEDPTQAKVLLEVLAARGVRIVLDDFGTGYSSLTYLSRLPVSKIKIDRSFVIDLDTTRVNEKIVETVIDLGRRLGIEILAEGVETSDVWDRLVTIGCRQVQGFYVSRPLPADQVVPWWVAHRSGQVVVTH